MKIGILTYHRAKNYGAMLQAYALRTFLCQKGYEVEFIDYWPTEHAKEYAIVRPLNGNILGIFKNIVAYSITFWRRLIRIKNFEYFAKKYLNLPHHALYTKKESCIKEKYDCIIVGSDQIWRNWSSSGQYYGFDKTYFCQTLLHPAHCISYAASMGIIDINADERQQLKQYLCTFQTLLVRENSLCSLINQLGYKAEISIDPTLLFDQTHWNSLLPTINFCQEKYLLYYELTPSKEAYKIAIHMAKQLNCKLLTLDARIPYIPHKNHISYASPIDFMHAIRDAEYVVSTSFHGTAFSLIFEKQFVTIGLNRNADRVITLLQSLGISDHYQAVSPHFPSPINYAIVRPILQELRLQSEELLLTSIQEA